MLSVAKHLCYKQSFYNEQISFLNDKENYSNSRNFEVWPMFFILHEMFAFGGTLSKFIIETKGLVCFAFACICTP